MELRNLARAGPVMGAVGSLLVIGASALWVQLGVLDGIAAWMGGLGGVLLIGYALLDQERLSDAATARSFAYTARSWLAVVLAAGLFVGGYAVARRYDTTWDWTQRGTYSLSQHTREVLAGLDRDVTITAFFGSSSPGRAPFRDLVRLFDEASDRIVVDHVDPLTEPGRARTAGVTGDHGTVFVQAGAREERLDWEISEQDLVRAITLVQSEEDHRLCWSLGHGEPSPDDEMSPRGLGSIRVELERGPHTVTEQRIAQGGVDRDCDLLIVVHPEQGLRPYELEAIAAYVAEGGRLLAMLDPFVAPAWAEDLERYGMLVGGGAIRDANPENQLLGVTDRAITVLSEKDFAPHPITRSLTASVVLPDARPVRAMLESPGITTHALLHTSAQAWAEHHPELVPNEPDPEVDELGPLPVMVAAEVEDPDALRVVVRPEGAEPAQVGDPAAIPAWAGVPDRFTPEPGGRVVVIGDSDFASNTFVGWGNNRDLALNAIAWLLDEEARIGERPPEGDTLVVSDLASALLCVMGTVLVPGAALAAAALTLLRRRRR